MIKGSSRGARFVEHDESCVPADTNDDTTWLRTLDLATLIGK